MGYETTILERKDGIGTLTLNRPENLNAINRKMTEELNSAMVEVAKDADVRALVVTRAGRGFCSGFDVGEMAQVATPIGTRNWIQMVHKAILDLTDSNRSIKRTDRRLFSIYRARVCLWGKV